jgi:hypothetical protein
MAWKTTATCKLGSYVEGRQGLKTFQHGPGPQQLFRITWSLAATNLETGGSGGV